jgi:hypothetical protein
VRITAELVECASQRAVWSERFDGDLADVFALEESIAEKVAAALELTLMPRAPTPTLEPATYQRFLRARGLLADGDPQFDNTASEAVPLLEAVTRMRRIMPRHGNSLHWRARWCCASGAARAISAKAAMR